MTVRSGASGVSLSCATPEEAAAVAVTLRISGPRWTGEMARSVRVRGNVVTVGAPHARFQLKKLRRVATEALEQLEAARRP